MARTDEVEFDGITFRRYPDSERRSDRVYYRPGGEHIEDGVEALHREIWKEHHGPIPDGHLIHHTDGDPTNNDIDNLECITYAEHVERHPDIGLSAEDIEKGVEAAKAWHRSEEGREWHRDHWEETLGALFDDPKTKECEQCGDIFEYYTAARFCSNACKAKWRRESGRDDEERTCMVCRQSFTTNKYGDTKTCSRRCGGILASWTKRLQSSD